MYYYIIYTSLLLVSYVYLPLQYIHSAAFWNIASNENFIAAYSYKILIISYVAQTTYHSYLAGYIIIITLRFVGSTYSVLICTIIQVIKNGVLSIISQQSSSTANIMHQ